jgi:hypothetical protein
MKASAIVAHARLVAALRSPRCFAHPAGRIETIETHISTVVLAGKFAYKIKKPVDLGFADFSTLQKRRRACEAEVRLNRRTAPGIYLGVVPVTGSRQRPAFGGEGRTIEYAVRMRRFPAGRTLYALQRRGVLTLAHVEALAATVAAFHSRIAVAGRGGRFGSPARIRKEALDNFRQIGAVTRDRTVLRTLERLRAWTDTEFAKLRPLLEKRRTGGYVRECHGDLHLGNVTLIDGRPVPFDCIEFNAALRWIDVISEAAFTVMDLLAHGERALGFHFLNTYLEATGDYEGVEVLRFYLVYRALVRAKIAAIRARRAELKRYLSVATTLAEETREGLVILYGLSGSGKTTFARSLGGSLGAIRLRSDVERKRLHGLAAQARSGSKVGAGLYAAQATAATYQRLAELAGALLPSGFPVIVDAAFLRRSYRDLFRKLARSAGARFVIAACEAPLAELRRRVRSSERTSRDASEATLAVLERQIATREALTPAVRAAAVVCETADARRQAAALAQIELRLGLSASRRAGPRGLRRRGSARASARRRSAPRTGTARTGG